MEVHHILSVKILITSARFLSTASSNNRAICVTDLMAVCLLNHNTLCDAQKQLRLKSNDEEEDGDGDYLHRRRPVSVHLPVLVVVALKLQLQIWPAGGDITQTIKKGTGWGYQTFLICFPSSGVLTHSACLTKQERESMSV